MDSPAAETTGIALSAQQDGGITARPASVPTDAPKPLALHYLQKQGELQTEGLALAVVLAEFYNSAGNCAAEALSCSSSNTGVSAESTLFIAWLVKRIAVNVFCRAANFPGFRDGGIRPYGTRTNELTSKYTHMKCLFFHTLSLSSLKSETSAVRLA